MTKKTKTPSGLGRPCCLVSHSAPHHTHDDDGTSAHRLPRLQRASRQSPRSRTPTPSPSTGLLALLATFVIPTITPAHAAPTPVSPNARRRRRTQPSPDNIPTPIYLDFLCPPSRRLQQPQQPPQPPSHAPEEHPPPRNRRSITTAAQSCGCVIPIKFEQNDTGWMVADRWTLHGQTHPNVSNYFPHFSPFSLSAALFLAGTPCALRLR